MVIILFKLKALESNLLNARTTVRLIGFVATVVDSILWIVQDALFPRYSFS